MKSFAEAFFGRLGAQVDYRDGELVVDLPPDLATAFGKPRLYLVLPEPGGEPPDLSPDEDLLVYGSRVFEQMLALLAGRGEATQVRLPDCYPAEATATAPLPLHNCRLVDQTLSPATDRYYLVNFRLVYLSDEKLEEFFTVALDAGGQPRSDKLAELTGGDWLSPGQPIRVNPTTLRHIVEQAGEVVRQEADRRAAELVTALQPRLRTALLRLAGFYRHMADEVDTGDPDRDEAARAELRNDLGRKLADELERHRLRVTVTPLSYALVMVPMTHYWLTLATRSSQHTLDLERSRYTGRFEGPACSACGKPLNKLALCDTGHAAHPGCVETCRRCNRDICRGCGIKKCALCGQPACRDCMAPCARCKDWLCAAHVEPCPICGDACCPKHRHTCRWCGQSYCDRCAPKGECATCRQALATAPVDIAPFLPAGWSPGPYQWRRAENRTFIIYISRPSGPALLVPLLGRVVVVTDHAGQVVVERRFGWEKVLGRW